MIAFRVQHAAGRDDPLARLMAGMPDSTEIVIDHEASADPNPWRGYQACLHSFIHGKNEWTHGVVVQDDALVCKNFGAAVGLLVEARPNDVISLFVGGVAQVTAKDLRSALVRGKCWVPLHFRDVAHVVALVWPTAAAADFLNWSEDARLPGYRGVCRSDDAVLGEWLRRTRRTAWATVPSLVEHPDDVPTLIHRRERARGGEDKGRVAVAWIGDADPLELDWAA